MIPGAAKRVAHRRRERAARVIENVAAAVVDEFENAHGGIAEAQAVARRLVDVFGGGRAFLDEARRLVHGERLDARHDEAGRGGTDDRNLADPFEQRLHCRDDSRIGALARRELDQRDDIGRD